jgi:RNA polymerase sigma factor (sigma-70 family)
MVAKFTTILPGWLRRCGVQQADIADAVQEALVMALVKLRECPVDVTLDDATARHELMRIVSNVALRARRRAQRESERYLSIENVEMPTARDEEAWVQARVVVLTALENLDEPTRALIFAHEIEGQTNVEIAATLKVKEDAVEKRVFFAKQRLRTEVENLDQGWTRRRRLDGTF